MVISVVKHFMDLRMRLKMAIKVLNMESLRVKFWEINGDIRGFSKWKFAWEAHTGNGCVIVLSTVLWGVLWWESLVEMSIETFLYVSRIFRLLEKGNIFKNGRKLSANWLVDYFFPLSRWNFFFKILVFSDVVLMIKSFLFKTHFFLCFLKIKKRQ